MKFKVWDKVRLTREAISHKLKESMSIKYSIVLWSTVDEVSADKMYLVNYIWYSEEDLELVPEEPEFEYGEEIEVFTYDNKLWKKKIFIYKIPWNVWCAYACVHWNNIDEYKKWYSFEVELWRTARKLKPQLTRKEIAEKFGVSEDFILVD